MSRAVAEPAAISCVTKLVRFSAADCRAAADAVEAWNREGGLAFLYIRIRQGAPETLSRPKTKPYEVAERLAKFLGSRE